MNRAEASKVTCVVDSRLRGEVDAELSRMGVREAYSIKAKQVSLTARHKFLALSAGVALVEDRAEIIRFYVPRGWERTAMERVAAAADLFLPGRGSVFAEEVILVRSGALPWNEEMMADHDGKSVDPAGGDPGASYDLICCIVQRGRGDEIARTMLEMGLCVPIIGFGEGMGLRDRLGLLRITIPVKKELLWFLVPEGDSDFVLDTAVRKARLNEPGRGFIYRVPVRSVAVNSRLYIDHRRHVATMEQVISAVDELRGSAEWRRIDGAGRGHREKARNAKVDLASFTLICEEGTVSDSVNAAMGAGAGGATLVGLSLREENGKADPPSAGSAPGDGATVVSHARETCDLIVQRELGERLETVVAECGFFSSPANGFVEISSVSDAITYTGG